jgi:hypothetical protein
MSIASNTRPIRRVAWRVDAAVFAHSPQRPLFLCGSPANAGLRLCELSLAAAALSEGRDP